MRVKSCLFCIFWILTFSLINLSHQQYFQSPLGKYIGDQNYTKLFQQNQELIGIMFTNQHCQQCYYSERELTQIIHEIYQQKNVTIYRCELSANQQLQEQFYIKRFPMLHFVLPKDNNKSKRHTTLSSISLFPIYLLNKILTAQAVFETVKKLKYYLNLTGDTSIIRQKIIVKGDIFFSNQLQISNLYGLNSNYQELPLLIYKEQSQFKSLVSREGLQEQVNDCSLFVQHRKTCIKQENEEFLIKQTLEIMALERVNQFTQQIYKHFEQSLQQRYIFVAVLDSIFRRQQSQQYISMLNKILKKREIFGISILWMQAQINTQKLKHLGFQVNDHPPLFAYFDLKTTRKQVYGNKKGDTFDQKSILKFIKSIIKIDEQRLSRNWNEESLKQALLRLGFNRKIDFLPQKAQLQDPEIPVFILYLSYASFQQLDNKQLFYEKILSFNFLTKRIKRFSKVKNIRRFISFKQSKQCRSGNCGIKLHHDQEMKSITEKQLFRFEDLSEQSSLYLRQKFDLPDLYWVKEDFYLQFLEKQGRTAKKPLFQHLFIQI